jgi:hypothetical protein
MLLSLGRTISPAKAIRLLKAGSSKWVNESFPGRGRFSWQEGYGAFSIGSVPMKQDGNLHPATTRTSQADQLEEEFKKLLAAYGIQEE